MAVSLVGALGAWMRARPPGATQDALDRASQLVLGMELLGIDLDDDGAPELARLSEADRAVADQVRIWGQARREEFRRRKLAEARRAAEAAPAPARPANGASRVSVAAGTPPATPSVRPTMSAPVAAARPERPAVPAAATVRRRPTQSAPSVVHRAEPQSSVLVVDPARQPSPTDVDTERGPSAFRSIIGRYEELFWWGVCFVALALLAWRQFG